jgi:hypothetical protein
MVQVSARLVQRSCRNPLFGPLGRPNSEFLQGRCTDPLETWTIGKGLKSSARQSQKIMWDMGLVLPSWGLSGPNSEFLQGRCADPLETWTIGKGLKSSARQSQKIMLVMGLVLPSWGLFRTE